MADERRERAWAVFDQLAKVPADQREAVLRAACGDDLALRAEVERLLALDDRLTSVEGQAGFLESPLVRTPSPTDHIQGPAAPFQGKFALPHHIGRYRILRLLGEGGMGAVYEAEQDSPQRAVALKVIRPGLLAPAFLKRFKQEVEILGRLHHPGIAQIYEAGVAEDGQPFFAMEYIRGLTLGEYARVQSLTVQARVELMARVCDAVQHAHDGRPLAGDRQRLGQPAAHLGRGHGPRPQGSGPRHVHSDPRGQPGWTKSRRMVLGAEV